MKLLVSCLEASANLHLKEVLKHAGEVELLGIFDPALGSDPLYTSSDFGIMGVVDALKIYKKAKKAVEEVADLAASADAVLLIDSPAFNVPLAKAIRERNVKTRIIYYILPQVWAWKKKRVKKVEALCDRLACILPFEEKFWTKAEYVGNPLMDEIKEVKSGWSDEKVYAFLPGSRRGEIRKLMPVFKEVADTLDGTKLLAVPNHLKDEVVELYGDVSGFEILHDPHEAIYRASFGFICSGTATLETAIIGTPFVLAYKAKKLDWIIGRIFVRLPYVGLANLIPWFDGKKPMHPEYLQKEATPENLLKGYRELDRTRFMEDAVQLRQTLKAGGAAKTVASWIKENDEQ